MVAKLLNKASSSSSSKRSIAGSSAKASTTVPKLESPRTRAQKAQVAAAAAVQVSEDVPDSSTAMEVIPRYVRVPLGRSTKLNYQQARASAARKNGAAQPSTSTPTAMTRPPVSIFDAPPQVILPTVRRSTTEWDINAPVGEKDTGAMTDKGEETDPETPETTADQLPANTSAAETVGEHKDVGQITAPAYSSFGAEVDEDATDAEEFTIPSSPTPMPHNAQHGVCMIGATLSSRSQLDQSIPCNDASPAASHSQATVEAFVDNLQDPTKNMWNAGSTELPPPSSDNYQHHSDTSTHQCDPSRAPTNAHEPEPPLPSFQQHITPNPLVRAETDTDLAAKLDQLSVQATFLYNNPGEYAQFVHHDAAPTPSVHPPSLDSSNLVGPHDFNYQTTATPAVYTQASDASVPAGPSFCHEGPTTILPFASVWSQTMDKYYSNSVLSQDQTSTSPYHQTQQYRSYTPIEPKLFKSLPADYLTSRRDRPQVPTPSTRSKIYDDPQPEWRAKIKEMVERKSLEYTRSLNPFHRLIGPYRWDYSNGKRGPLYIAKPGEEPRKYCPLPVRATSGRLARPVKGSEEDLIERIEYERRLEAREARRAMKKAEKQIAKSCSLENQESRQTKKKNESRKSVKRSRQELDEERPAPSRPVKKQKH